MTDLHASARRLDSLSRAERLDSITRIADTFSQKEFAEIDLILKTFDIPTDDLGNWSSQKHYLFDMLSGASDHSLIELAAYIAGDKRLMDGDRYPWDAGSFRLFISHATADKSFATDLAATAKRIGIHGFVAHSSLQPNDEWLRTIESALMTCDALCALLTPEFGESEWCDQEVGIAIGRGVPTLSVKLSRNPHGLISKYQAISVQTNTGSPFGEVHELVRGLLRDQRTSASAAPVAATRFVRSGHSEESATAAFELLRLIAPKDWMPGMIADVDKALADNEYVRRASLKDGKRLTDAVQELLEPVRGDTAATSLDGDIPF